MIVQTFEMDFPNQKIERHLDQDHSVLPRGGRQAVSFLTFMSSSLVKEKTAARLILTPGIYQCQPISMKTLEILEKSSGGTIGRPREHWQAK